MYLPASDARLAREIKRFEAKVATAERALKDAPCTVESLRAEKNVTRALLVDRAEKRRLLMAKQEKQRNEGDGEAAEASEADAGACGANAPGPDEDEEGLEVEELFDPEPEVKSRFGDKRSLLKFVTAGEDARMRREELAMVFGDREAIGAGIGTGLSSVGAHHALEEKGCDDKRRSGPVKSANARERTAEKAGGQQNGVSSNGRMARAGATSGRIGRDNRKNPYQPRACPQAHPEGLGTELPSSLFSCRRSPQRASFSDPFSARRRTTWSWVQILHPSALRRR